MLHPTDFAEIYTAACETDSRKIMSNNDVYAALIAVLSKLIDQEKRAKGTTRLGGDYLTEAIAVVEQTKLKLGLN